MKMKKILKLLTSLSLAVTLAIIPGAKTHANATDDHVLNNSSVTVTIVNDETGEEKVLDSDIVKQNAKQIYSKRNGDSIEVGYDVFIPIEELSDEISTLTSTGGSQTEGGVTAKLYVDYDVSSNNEKVRLNKVWGSWSPSSSMYYLSTRSVNAHSGFPYGNRLTKSPSSNSFSYTTGWGFNDRIWGDSAPRAWSSAKIHITGMTATHTINVEFTYS